MPRTCILSYSHKSACMRFPQLVVRCPECCMNHLDIALGHGKPTQRGLLVRSPSSLSCSRGNWNQEFCSSCSARNYSSEVQRNPALLVGNMPRRCILTYSYKSARMPHHQLLARCPECCVNHFDIALGHSNPMQHCCPQGSDVTRWCLQWLKVPSLPKRAWQ